jgi:hypothetical protein
MPTNKEVAHLAGVVKGPIHFKELSMINRILLMTFILISTVFANAEKSGDPRSLNKYCTEMIFGTDNYQACLQSKITIDKIEACRGQTIRDESFQGCLKLSEERKLSRESISYCSGMTFRRSTYFACLETILDPTPAK